MTVILYSHQYGSVLTRVAVLVVNEFCRYYFVLSIHFAKFRCTAEIGSFAFVIASWSSPSLALIAGARTKLVISPHLISCIFAYLIRKSIRLTSPVVAKSILIHTMLDNFLPSAVYSSDYQRHLLPPLLAGTIGTINTITPPPHISVSLSPTDFELSFIESSVQPKKRPARMARSTKKAPRHPSAPKRNMSAYLMYQNAMRESFKAQNPGMSFGQLSKYSSGTTM